MFVKASPACFCCYTASFCVYMSHSYSLTLNPICLHVNASNYAVTHFIHLLPPSLPPPLPSCPPFLCRSFPSSPVLCRRVCVCVCVMRWEPEGIKSSQGFAVVLVGSWSPLSRDQMGLGRSGTRPQALDNTASPAMCEHLFSSIKTVI